MLAAIVGSIAQGGCLRESSGSGETVPSPPLSDGLGRGARMAGSGNTQASRTETPRTGRTRHTTGVDSKEENDKPSYRTGTSPHVLGQLPPQTGAAPRQRRRLHGLRHPAPACLEALRHCRPWAQPRDTAWGNKRPDPHERRPVPASEGHATRRGHALETPW